MQQLFERWAAATARGERPDTLEYLRRAGDDADALAALIEAYRRAEPRREPDEETLALTRAWAARESPLVVLRARRGLRRDDVVETIEREFALPPEKRKKLKDYYHRLESGLLEPAALSGRLVEALARVFETTPADVRAWRTRALVAKPAFRAPSATATELVEAKLAEPPQELDEIDALFLSGTD